MSRGVTPAEIQVPEIRSYVSQRRRKAEAAARYRITQVDRDEFDANRQIDDIIRETPISVDGKRILKAQYPTQEVASTAHYWIPYLHSFSVKWSRFRHRIYDLSPDFELWRSSLKLIEGKFGTAVVSYFVFLKWLLLLNIYISLIGICWIVLPQIAFSPQYRPSNETEPCEKAYESTITSDCRAVCLTDVIEGSGPMERTILFHGAYIPYYIWDEPVEGQDIINSYNLPLAYLLTTLGIFILSFLLMVSYTSESLQESLANNEDTHPVHSNAVFCGWDHRLTDIKAASVKKGNTHLELKIDLAESRLAQQRRERTPSGRLALYTTRILLNMLVFAIQGGAFALIFYVTDFHIRNSQGSNNSFVDLLISFLPSVTITALNALIPDIFSIIVQFERYSPDFGIGLTLLRTVFLKLASILVLFFSLYPQVHCAATNRNKECRFCENSGIRCWETAVGQEFYRLYLTDFASAMLSVLVLEYPRKFATSYLNIPLVKRFGHMEFNIPKNVLAIVYSQALCWIGLFYCPFLPLMTAVKFFIVFYLKKFSLLSNMAPARHPFRASRSGIFFMIILIVTFLVCIIPVGYTIVSIEPSRSCGPFRLEEDGKFIWDELQQSLEMWDSVLGDVLHLVGSTPFCISVIIFLGLLLYYYASVGFTQLAMIKNLRHHLISEGKDKRFLMNQIDTSIQQQYIEIERKRNMRPYRKERHNGGGPLDNNGGFPVNRVGPSKTSRSSSSELHTKNNRRYGRGENSRQHGGTRPRHTRHRRDVPS